MGWRPSRGVESRMKGTPAKRSASSSSCHRYMLRGMDSHSRDCPGMTINERLHSSDLLVQFDEAIRASDRQAAIDMLCRVAFTDAQARWTVEAVLSNPQKYGYF